ncbi:acriflavin resistance protein [Vibrio astriarenae]|nr:acriflavin resistance protein [Vibrio sp. C7]
MIRLGDIANVTMDYQKPALTENRFNGEPAVTLAVSQLAELTLFHSATLFVKS